MLVTGPFGNVTEAVFISNCVLSGNSEVGLQLMNVPTGIITDCSFYENQETPIGAYKSTFVLRGEHFQRQHSKERRWSGPVQLNSGIWNRIQYNFC